MKKAIIILLFISIKSYSIEYKIAISSSYLSTTIKYKEQKDEYGFKIIDDIASYYKPLNSYSFGLKSNIKFKEKMQINSGILLTRKGAVYSLPDSIFQSYWYPGLIKNNYEICWHLDIPFYLSYNIYRSLYINVGVTNSFRIKEDQWTMIFYRHYDPTVLLGAALSYKNFLFSIDYHRSLINLGYMDYSPLEGPQIGTKFYNQGILLSISYIILKYE